MPSQVPSASPGTRCLPPALVIMPVIVTAAVALTCMVPSARYKRTKMGLAVPGTFQLIPKDVRTALLDPRTSTDTLAYAASPADGRHQPARHRHE